MKAEPASLYTYQPEILDQLAGHGLIPGPDTPPRQVRDALRDLYKYEIRRLKGRLLHGEFPKAEYAGLVVALRKRYWLLSVPTEHWVIQ